MTNLIWTEAKFKMINKTKYKKTTLKITKIGLLQDTARTMALWSLLTRCIQQREVDPGLITNGRASLMLIRIPKTTKFCRQLHPLNGFLRFKITMAKLDRTTNSVIRSWSVKLASTAKLNLGGIRQTITHSWFNSNRNTWMRNQSYAIQGINNYKWPVWSTQTVL